jgi:hypothetical protein
MKRIWLRNTSLALACVALGVPLSAQAPGASAASTTTVAMVTVPYPMLGTNLTTEYVAAGTRPSDTVTVTDDVSDVIGAAVTTYMWGPLQAPVTDDCSALSLAQFDTKSPGVGTYADMISNLTGLWLSGNGSYTALGPVANTSACYGWTSVETFPEDATTTTTSSVPPTPTTTAPTPKRTTITCMRGKTIRKMTAVSPACPRGYKKTRTINCVRGKTTKTVTAVSPACPRGYRVKKTNPPTTTTTTISTQVARLASCGDCGAAALINADRASVGLPPLIVTEDDPSVELSALLFVSSADDPGNAAWLINPTLTARQAAALAVSEWWAEGSGPFGEAHGHYDNIANPNARYLSVSVAFQQAGTPAGPGWVVNASF